MKLVWTGKAVADYEAIIDYLLDEWTVKEAQAFIDKVAIAIAHIQEKPYLFEGSTKIPYLRKGKIDAHNTLIYQVDETEIILLQFADNRSDHPY